MTIACWGTAGNPAAAAVAAWALLVKCASLSLMAIGGGVVALTPEVMTFVVDTRHWMTAPEFLACYTLAQVAPGPNVTFVTALGWRVAGWPGALAATLGLLVPSTAVNLLIVQYGLGRGGALAALFRRALVPLSVGMLLASGWSLARMAAPDALTIGLLVVSTAATVLTRSNPLWWIALGAVVGGILLN